MVRKSADMKSDIRENLRGGKGKLTFTHMFEADEMMGKARLAAVVTIQPGDSIGEHTHGPDAEFYIITKGSGIVNDNGTMCDVTAGDVMFTGGGDMHSIENNGDSPLEMIAIVVE